MIPIIMVLAVFGLSVGSFLNVCAYRIPKGISLIQSSFCPSCRSKLNWFDLIPVISFIIVKGKCRNCRSAVSTAYPVVEMFSAGLVVLLYLMYGSSWSLVRVATFAVIMIPIAVIDWKHLIIPNKIVVFGLIVGIGLNAVAGEESMIEYSLSSLIAAGISLAILLSGNWIFKKPVLGMGDVKLSALIGLFLGLQNFIVAFWFGTVICTAYGLNQILSKRASPGVKLPFGSFLAAAGVVVFVSSSFIDQLIESWLTLLQ